VCGLAARRTVFGGTIKKGGVVMYQALYRKWRPRSFDDVVGQQHITETLKRQLMGDRLSHAYLFVGTRGTGKTTCAKILAKAANCEHPVNGNPCNACASCRGIDSGAILDVEELDAASNNGVDNVRALRDEAVYSPAAVRKRVYIVDEVHMLSASAFNALLKILEEPPEHLIFILATTEVHKVPATILSRCQRFSFRRITPADIAARLAYVAAQERLPLTDDAAQLLARLGDGSMRDALSLLDQCSAGDPIDVNHVLATVGLAGAAGTMRLLDDIADGNTADALEALHTFYYNGKDLGAVLEELAALCRDVLLTRIAPEGCANLLSGNFSPEDLARYAALSSPRLLSAVRTIQEASADMGRAADRRITAELCLIQLCDETLSPDIAAIRSRLAQLEETVQTGAVPARREPERTAPVQAAPVSEPAAVSVPVPAAPSAPAAAPVPEPETVPELEPVPEPVPAPAAEKPAADETAAWFQILDAVRGKVDMPVYSFLGDPTHVVPKIEPGTLTLQTRNVIAMSLLQPADVQSVIKAQAERVLGAPVAVKLAEYRGRPVTAEDKLDALARFGNVKFE